MLLTFGDPPTAVDFHILVVVAHGVCGEHVFAVLLGHERGKGVTGAGGVGVVDEVDALLPFM